jgi:hypothetical protein
MDLALTIAAVVVEVIAVAMLVWDRRVLREKADKLERSGEPALAANVRHRAFQAEMGKSPPPWDRAASLEWAHSAEARNQWAATSRARAEALREMAEPLESIEQRERRLRASMASELRSGAGRTLVIGVLVGAGAVAGAIGNLLS